MTLTAGQLERASGGIPGQDSPSRPSLTPFSDQAAAARWAVAKLRAMKAPHLPNPDESDPAYLRGVRAGYDVAIMRLVQLADVAESMAAKVRG